MMIKLSGWIFSSLITGLLLLQGAWVWYAIYPVTPMQVGQIVPLPANAPAGTTIWFDTAYCLEEDGRHYVARDLVPVDERITSRIPTERLSRAFMSRASDFKKGCHRTQVGVDLPIFLPPGEYYVRYTRIWWLKSGHRTTITYTTPIFFVEAPQ